MKLIASHASDDRMQPGQLVYDKVHFTLVGAIFGKYAVEDVTGPRPMPAVITGLAVQPPASTNRLDGHDKEADTFAAHGQHHSGPNATSSHWPPGGGHGL
ncbi:hypothetical protein Ahu01nite_053490 [Winogradskya humida]|uniref:Uncharacterized protein n=1 Tax=Winogradskya humida TaxID=113566 RepID=A0ABQ3ZUG5_9ACTN|nr:hypothetical protein Ahu01nite_053490 [Actinoplanes humidus]